MDQEWHTFWGNMLGSYYKPVVEPTGTLNDFLANMTNDNPEEGNMALIWANEDGGPGGAA